MKKSLTTEKKIIAFCFFW